MTAQDAIASPRPDEAGVLAAGAEIEDIEPPQQPKSRIWMIRLASIVFVFGAWEVLGRQVDPLFMSWPSAILVAGWKLAASGELWSALWSSMRTLLLAFFISSVIGVLLGLVIGRYRTVEAATDWCINALYATPLVAVVPLVVLWFGLGDGAKLFIVTILAVFPILINTIAGVRNVPPTLIGDAARIRQLLLNLAGNAVKFTEKGGIGVRVSMTPEGAVRFAVADTGPGIPADRQASIFEEFEQVDGSATTKHEGAGLGLAISRRIIAAMGGTLTLEHSSPRGSVFAFSVDLAAAPKAAPAHAGPTLSGRRALIVGQSPFEAPYLGERLAAAGIGNRFVERGLPHSQRLRGDGHAAALERAHRDAESASGFTQQGAGADREEQGGR